MMLTSVILLRFQQRFAVLKLLVITLPWITVATNGPERHPFEASKVSSSSKALLVNHIVLRLRSLCANPAALRMISLVNFFKRGFLVTFVKCHSATSALTAGLAHEEEEEAGHPSTDKAAALKPLLVKPNAHLPGRRAQAAEVEVVIPAEEPTQPSLPLHLASPSSSIFSGHSPGRIKPCSPYHSHTSSLHIWPYKHCQRKTWTPKLCQQGPRI